MIDETVMIPIEEIDVNEEFNCRGKISPVDVMDLANDIEAHGLISPVVVMRYSEEDQIKTGKKYLLIIGYRRTTAHMILRRTEIKANVRDTMTEDDARVLNLSENIQRKDLDILQEAYAIKHLADLGLKRDAISKRLGKSKGWVQLRLMVLDFPHDIQLEIKNEKISQPQIRQLYTLWDGGKGREVTYAAVREIKDAKAHKRPSKLKKIVSVKKKKQIKHLRKKSEILEMVGKLLDVFGTTISTRLLAWAAGEVSDREINAELDKYALDQDKVWDHI